MTKLPGETSASLFKIRTEEDFRSWLRSVDKAAGGVTWMPLGGIENNVHTVEVASDSGLALIERPTNSIDALLDFEALKRGESAPTPHEGARRWLGVPAEGLSGLDSKGAIALADRIRVTMLESGDADRPTITIQDEGTGQHPDSFADTLLSLLKSNKKTKSHQMGVYNAGGAASCRFAKVVLVASRLAPVLLNGKSDEIGVSAIRYNPLDADKFKSGVYEYLAAKDGSILRLGLESLPDLAYGTFVALVEYEIPNHARAAHEPKSSLWHLFHSCLPDPALPVRIIETRAKRFPGVKGEAERRVVRGLRHLLSNKETTAYKDERSIDLGDAGKVAVRYFVLSDDRDPDAYTTTHQGLTIMLNGQRQITRDRQWVKRNLQLHFLFRRLVILVDATGLKSAAKREVFSSTRETGVDTPLSRRILDRVVEDLKDDEHLGDLDEQAREKTLKDATKSLDEKIRKKLASQIASFLKGRMDGEKGGGGGGGRRRRRRRRPIAPPRDDSALPEVPDSLGILTNPLEVHAGRGGSLVLEINAKNGFIPRHQDALSVVLDPAIKESVRVASTGTLNGGQLRIRLVADANAAVGSYSLKVALIVPTLGVFLTCQGEVKVLEPEQDEDDPEKSGGEPDIGVKWVGRDRWESFAPAWDGQTAGMCIIKREDLANKAAITGIECILNEAFGPFDKVLDSKNFGEVALENFRNRYAVPVVFGLFRQQLALEAKAAEADKAGLTVEIPEDYQKGEKERIAGATLIALEPEIDLFSKDDD